ncbi:MAG: UbiA family prenyltransferase [Gaiellaceae bacterium]
MSFDAATAVSALPARWRAAGAVLVACRPLQWTKNLLVFAGILFSANLDDGGRWVAVWTCFAAYCAASSGAYLVNDVRDRAADAAHPVKRRRAIAAGHVAPRTAVVLSLLLFALAAVLAASLGGTSLLPLALFVALQGVYTFALKEVAVLDVLAIAALFVVRAAAGAAAVDVPISTWLLVCTALLASFLALGKRRAELLLVEANETRGRRVLRRYSRAGLDRALPAVGAVTVAVYAAYTLVGRDSPALVVTVPLVASGIGRYAFLLRRRRGGEEPDQVLLSDRPLLATICVWAAICAVIPAFE